MSIDQQPQKSYETFPFLSNLPNPDNKTDRERSSTTSRKLSELSTNIKPGKESINQTDSSNPNTQSKQYSHSLSPQSIPIQNINNKSKSEPKSKSNKIMGAKFKPIMAILFDYLIALLFGGIYYAILNYANIQNQCIPGQANNKSYCVSDNDNDPMNHKTSFLAYPYRDKPVPVSYPYIFGGVHWFVVLFLNICWLCPNLKMFKILFIKLEALWREVLTSIIATQMVVGFIKRFVGAPRPNYYAYINIDSDDAISSFPSGHASSSFCIHILLVYHVIGSIYWSYGNNLPVTADNIHSLFGAKLWMKTRHLSSFNVLLVLCLLALPVWISCTRITDYYHHYSDVLAGALLGILISSIVFSVFHNELYPHNSFYNKDAREPLLSNVSDD